MRKKRDAPALFEFMGLPKNLCIKILKGELWILRWFKSASLRRLIYLFKFLYAVGIYSREDLGILGRHFRRKEWI